MVLSQQPTRSFTHSQRVKIANLEVVKLLAKPLNSIIVTILKVNGIQELPKIYPLKYLNQYPSQVLMLLN
jgi:hypothetical protein